MMKNTVRISHLGQPFLYKTMQDIEQSRRLKADDDLPHRHDFYTIIALKDGAGSHQIDFKTHVLAPNTLYFISPEQIHHLALSSAQVDGHVVMFTADFLVQHAVSLERLTEMHLFFNCDEAKPLALDAAQMAQLDVFWTAFATENPATDPLSKDALGAWLKLLLLNCQRFKMAQKAVNLQLEKRQSEIVRRFKNDVESHFRKWHQVNDYAQAQHLTSNYLNDIIKTETGTSAKDFIQNRLILEAKRLARYSDWSAKEIAFHIGYEDVAHFSRFFKKCEGISFTAFRDAASALG